MDSVQRQLLRLQQEALKRAKDDPLLNFKPHKKQKMFMDACLGGESYLIFFFAANRCITPWTPVETGSSMRLPEELIGEKGFYVRSWDGDSLCTKRASPLFLKGIEPAYRFLLDNGSAFEATSKHRVLTPSGWLSLESLMSMPNGRHLMGTTADYLANYDEDDHQYDQPPRMAIDNGTAKLRPAIDVPQLPRDSGAHADVVEPTPERIHACLESYRLSTPDDPRLIADLCALWKVGKPNTSDRYSYLLRQDGRPPGGESSPVRTEHKSHHGARPKNAAVSFLLSPIALQGGVKLIGYQEIGLRPILDFEVEDTHCYIAGGAIHHNSGKTECGSAVGANLARFGPAKPNSIYMGAGKDFMEVRDRATSGWVVSLDFNNSQEVVQPKYFDNGFVAGGGNKPFIPEREIKEWRIKDQVLKLKNGSIVGFRSCDSEVKKFQGAGKDWIHFDEEPPKEIFDEATIRVGAGRRLLVFVTCTLLPPPGQVGGVTWSYNEFVKPWQRGELKEAEIITASIYDNPHILPAEIARLEARYGKDSLMGRIRLGGELLPGVSGSRAYPSFDRNIHVRELGEMDPGRPLAWCWDFNVAPMITEVAQLWGNKFKFFDELVIADGGNIPDMVEKFYERYHDWRSPIWLYGDQTGSNRGSQTGISDWHAIMNCLRPHNFTVAKKIPEKNPFVSMRLNSMQMAFKDEHGESHVEIDPRCRELIEDFESVLLDPGGGIKKSRKPQEAYYQRSHASDGASYLVAYEKPIRESTMNERETVKIKDTRYGFQKRT